MVEAVTSAIPPPNNPVVTAGNGIVTIPWFLFFQKLWERTGGGTGGNFGPGQQIALTSTPFVFAPTNNGTLVSSGGGIYQMLLSRQGGPQYPVGSFYGASPLKVGDSITLRFVGTPLLVFFPG